MTHNRRTLTVACVLVPLALACAMSILAMTSTASGARPATALSLISNQSGPAAMDKHFNQHPRGTFPASSLGLPDGTCYVYGNKVSWIVFQCFGAQPEVKP